MTMRLFATAAALITALFPGVAHADPGVGDPVYGATLQKGITEFEARYGRLNGRTDDGADGLVLEAEHAFSNRFSAAILVETDREPGGHRRAQSASIEAIHTLGRIKPLALDVAFYGEYKIGFRGNDDVAEAKLLLQHHVGKFDARVNLIGERALRAGEAVDIAYAASVDWALIGDDIRLGAAAFGDLGSTQHFGGRQAHFVGPEAKVELEHIGRGELEIEAGWLRAFGAARNHADGQARLLIGYEMKF